MVGVLEPSFTADDEAIFVDVKTAWVIQGLVHGHQDLAAPEAAAGVLKREGDTIIGNATVVQYNEITADNVDSFHFHGDMSDYPLSAVIAVPKDQKSGIILMGRYEGDEEPSQIVQPTTVMNELLDTILTIRGFVVAAILLVAAGLFVSAYLTVGAGKAVFGTLLTVTAAAAGPAQVPATEHPVDLRAARPVAGKLHTGRSRNDQVCLDLRLYLRRQADARAARQPAVRQPHRQARQVQCDRLRAGDRGGRRGRGRASPGWAIQSPLLPRRGT